MQDLSEPYYFSNRKDFTHLEAELSILPPSLRGNYRRLEQTVSQAFLEHYGRFLTDEQKQYMTGNQMIFTDYKTADRFSKDWDKGIKSIDVDDAVIGKNVYVGYSVGENPKDTTKTPEGAKVGQFWAGRIAIFPLGENEIFEVDQKWLMSEEQYEKSKDREDIKSVFASIQPYVYTSAIGGAAIHEKTHGIQDWRLPFPILEAAAHYYQRELFTTMNWNNEIGNNMEKLADLYGECLKEIGDDLHRLMFGNINEPDKRNRLISLLKGKFTPEKIDELSQYSEHDWWPMKWRWINWKKVPESVARRKLELKSRVKK